MKVSGCCCYCCIRYTYTPHYHFGPWCDSEWEMRLVIQIHIYGAIHTECVDLRCDTTTTTEKYYCQITWHRMEKRMRLWRRSPKFTLQLLSTFAPHLAHMQWWTNNIIWRSVYVRRWWFRRRRRRTHYHEYKTNNDNVNDVDRCSFYFLSSTPLFLFIYKTNDTWTS